MMSKDRIERDYKGCGSISTLFRLGVTIPNARNSQKNGAKMRGASSKEAEILLKCTEIWV